MNHKAEWAKREAAKRVRIEGDVAYITLTRGMVAAIDAIDVPLVIDRCWHATHGKNTWYAASRGADHDGQSMLLHRRLLGYPPEGVDHRDGDGLNCRRGNLRLASTAQNSANRKAQRNSRSGIKGVCFNKQRGNWMVQLTVKGVVVFRKQFKSQDAAVLAYAEASRVHNGEFARCN